ncbi:MAG TPA: hypothetical protein PKC34_08035 [Pseudomonadales bacterium]|nr:hypothetical protein [Pseudomonadales bacterium]HMW15481.1 hypothetical protein [Pseudomonadales bacterium]HMW83697.1 hypothetical protein [Pseudomonadales bacterium]HMY97544.1 hypothetical protein [Pseudomonadales bacterium]HMZ71295.1 hypothetical protein [Pseudomonadales bacterium]
MDLSTGCATGPVAVRSGVIRQSGGVLFDQAAASRQNRTEYECRQCLFETRQNEHLIDVDRPSRWVIVLGLRLCSPEWVSTPVEKLIHNSRGDDGGLVSIP